MCQFRNRNLSNPELIIFPDDVTENADSIYFKYLTNICSLNERHCLLIEMEECSVFRQHYPEGSTPYDNNTFPYNSH